MAKHRSHSIEFKRQIAQEFIAGETLHGLAPRRLTQPNPNCGVKKLEAGAFDEDARAADLLQEDQALRDMPVHLTEEHNLLENTSVREPIARRRRRPGRVEVAILTIGGSDFAGAHAIRRGSEKVRRFVRHEVPARTLVLPMILHPMTGRTGQDSAKDVEIGIPPSSLNVHDMEVAHVEALLLQICEPLRSEGVDAIDVHKKCETFARLAAGLFDKLPKQVIGGLVIAQSYVSDNARSRLRLDVVRFPAPREELHRRQRFFGMGIDDRIGSEAAPTQRDGAPGRAACSASRFSLAASALRSVLPSIAIRLLIDPAKR